MKKTLFTILTLCSLSFAQTTIFPKTAVFPKTTIFGAMANPAITLDASCTGNGTVSPLPCSSAMTLTAGDAIYCNATGVSGGNNETGSVGDAINGHYDNVFGFVHPVTSLSYAPNAVFANSAGGSITPNAFFSSSPLARATISCYAFKNTATSSILDGGGVEQATSATVTNPTSGTATAPSNNNEAVAACMSRSSSTAPNSGGGAWLPAGALTVVGSSSVRQACEYQIQTTATAVNGSFTGNAASLATLDSQIAILPLGTTGGYRALTGVFVPLGAPASAPTGTMSAALLGAAASTLSTTNIGTSPFWTLGGTAPTYDTTINPTGTGKIMVDGVTHTFGDAGSSMLTAGASGSSFFSAADQWGAGLGTPRWLSFFFRMASGGATGQGCDDASIGGGATDGQMILQFRNTTASTYNIKLESVENAGSVDTANLSMDTDYWIQEHLAGANERYHQILVYGCGTANCHGATNWTLSSTLNFDHLCTNGANATCSIPAAVVSPTGTASSGSTALTISAGTSTANGQLVLDPTNSCIPYPTLVEAGGTTTAITLSQNTTCPISATTVNFYTVPANLKVATNCSVTAGSTAMSCVAPGVGTITVGYAIGATGILQGTQVAAVSGAGPISVTLSLPAQSTLTNAGIAFWSLSGGGTFSFGKNSGGTCGVTANEWFSGLLWDPNGTWGAFAPN